MGDGVQETGLPRLCQSSYIAMKVITSACFLCASAFALPIPVMVLEGSVRPPAIDGEVHKVCREWRIEESRRRRLTAVLPLLVRSDGGE